MYFADAVFCSDYFWSSCHPGCSMDYRMELGHGQRFTFYWLRSSRRRNCSSLPASFRSIDQKTRGKVYGRFTFLNQSPPHELRRAVFYLKFFLCFSLKKLIANLCASLFTNKISFLYLSAFFLSPKISFGLCLSSFKTETIGIFFISLFA